MNQNLSKLMVVVGLLACGITAHASLKTADYDAIIKKMAPAKENLEGGGQPYLVTEADAQAIKKAAASERSPAAVDDVRSAELIALSNELLAINYLGNDINGRVIANQKLDDFLFKLENNYNTYKNADTQLFATLLIPLRTLRGIVWKTIPVFEAAHAKFVHSAVLTAFKESSASMGLTMPDQSWKVGFDYVTMPYTENGVAVKEFSNEAELQSHIIYKVYDKVMDSKNRLVKIDVTNQIVVWDNQIGFGPKSFKDHLGQFKKVGVLEKSLLLAETFLSLANLEFLRSYDINGSLELATALGVKYGFDAAIGEVRGVTHEDRYHVMHKGNTPLYTVGYHLPQYTEFMPKARIDLQNALTAFNAVWKESKARPAGSQWLYNTGFIQVDQTFGDKKIETIMNALKGPIRIRNDVTGESTLVDLYGFFAVKPPNSLQDLDASSFDKPGDPSGKEWIYIKSNSLDPKFSALNGKKFRDYFRGGPNTWDYTKYSTLFPEAKNSEDIKRSVRVFEHVFSSLSHWMPLNAVGQ